MPLKSSTGLELSRRQKRWAPRSRSGCITCRRRRIKCDETKPHCNKCTTVKLPCTGENYGNRAIKLAHGRLHQPDALVSPFAQRPGSDERQMMHIFRLEIVPDMLDIFDHELWSVLILRASHMYPSLWHAMVATATAKHLVCIRPNVSDGSRQEAILYNYALRHCNIAFSQLQEINHQTATPADWETLLLTCIVLIQYTLLRGNNAEVMTHIINGLRISGFLRSKAAETTKSHTANDAALTTTIQSAHHWFLRLEVALRMTPVRLGEPTPAKLPVLRISSSEPFSSSEDAYWELLAIDIQWKKMIRSEIVHSGYAMLQFVAEECRQLHRPFRIWQQKLHDFQATMKPLRGDDYTDRIESIRRVVLRLLEPTLETLIMVDPSEGELGWDKFNDNFATIVTLSEELLDKNKATILCDDSQAIDLTASSQFRSLIGFPLMTAGAFCRIPHFRARSLAMMKTISFTDGLFDSDLFVSVFLERKIFEETGYLQRPFETGCSCIEELYICNGHRVCQIFLPMSCPGRPSEVVFRTTRNVENGEAGTHIPLCVSKEKQGVAS